jgi:putative membrane protein
MLSLEMFGFRAMWSPYFFVVLIFVTLLFFLAATKYKEQLSSEADGLTKKQGILFVSTIVLLYVIKGSPLDLLGHIMFSAHMTQMAFLYLVIPPMLIASIPHWMWRKLLEIRLVGGVFHFFTKPLIALVVFNGLFSFYHIPLIFDVIKVDMVLHAIYTTILFISAIFMWWPLVNHLQEYQYLYGIKRIGYIFANGVLLTPACALIIFADNPMYATFSDPRAWAQALELCVPTSALSGLSLSGPEMFNWLPLLEDQQLGGVLMKIIQEIVYGTVLAQIFYEWYRKENADAEKIDPIPDLQSVE